MRLIGGLDGLGSGLDELHHVIGVGDHRHVVGGDFGGGGAHAGGELLTSGAVQGVIHCPPERVAQARRSAA